MNNYPDGMSYSDLIHVGEYDDPDATPDWFGELINENHWDDVEELWSEFNETDWYCEAQAQTWLEATHPEAALDAA